MRRVREHNTKHKQRTHKQYTHARTQTHTQYASANTHSHNTRAHTSRARTHARKDAHVFCSSKMRNLRYTPSLWRTNSRAQWRLHSPESNTCFSCDWWPQIFHLWTGTGFGNLLLSIHVCYISTHLLGNSWRLKLPLTQVQILISGPTFHRLLNSIYVYSYTPVSWSIWI